MKQIFSSLVLVVAICLCQDNFLIAQDPLPSWHDSTTKQRLLEFVARISDKNSGDYVPVSERIAVFDNDGTLWCEQPFYTQLAFAVFQAQRLTEANPEIAKRELFKAVKAGDMKSIAKEGEKGIAELMMVTHAGMTTDQFNQSVRDWLKSAKHPKLQRSYLQCVYQPMLEVIKLLQQHQFKTYIVSGGGVDFMRVFSEECYGIPPEQVIGSTIKTTYEEREGQSVLVRQPELAFIDDKGGKPVGIHYFIGRRPIIAFGNSDGDYQMLRYVTDSKPSEERACLGVIVHHTDAEREFAYDRNSPIGKLDVALHEAPQRKWLVVDMKKDWKTVFVNNTEVKP